jgi:hypothetical protein
MLQDDVADWPLSVDGAQKVRQDPSPTAYTPHARRRTRLTRYVHGEQGLTSVASTSKWFATPSTSWNCGLPFRPHAPNTIPPGISAPTRVHTMTRFSLYLAVALGLLALLAPKAQPSGDNYPTRPIKLVVGHRPWRIARHRGACHQPKDAGRFRWDNPWWLKTESVPAAHLATEQAWPRPRQMATPGDWVRRDNS